jgi:hypothetical protein
VHRLNPSAATIWRMCQGDASAGELVDMLVDTLELPPHDVDAEVAALLLELDELGLVEDASIEPVMSREKRVTSV